MLFKPIQPLSADQLFNKLLEPSSKVRDGYPRMFLKEKHEEGWSGREDLNL